MKFLGLDGREHGVDSNRYLRRERSKSQGQQKLGDILQELFTSYQIYEEFPCLGTKLRLDFLIPGLSMAFEFDGEQHEEYTPHFHKTRSGFARSISNDAEKEDWCAMNGIALFRISEEDFDNIEDIIREA